MVFLWMRTSFPVLFFVFLCITNKSNSKFVFNMMDVLVIKYYLIVHTCKNMELHHFTVQKSGDQFLYSKSICFQGEQKGVRKPRASLIALSKLFYWWYPFKKWFNFESFLSTITCSHLSVLLDFSIGIWKIHSKKQQPICIPQSTIYLPWCI